MEFSVNFFSNVALVVVLILVALALMVLLMLLFGALFAHVGDKVSSRRPEQSVGVANASAAPVRPPQRGESLSGLRRLGTVVGFGALGGALIGTAAALIFAYLGILADPLPVVVRWLAAFGAVLGAGMGILVLAFKSLLEFCKGRGG